MSVIRFWVQYVFDWRVCSSECLILHIMSYAASSQFCCGWCAFSHFYSPRFVFFFSEIARKSQTSWTNRNSTITNWEIELYSLDRPLIVSNLVVGYGSLLLQASCSICRTEISIRDQIGRNHEKYAISFVNADQSIDLQISV